MTTTAVAPAHPGPRGAAARRFGRLAGGGAHPVRPLALAFAAYLALSVALWWGVWSTHPTSVTVCGCGDTSLFTWWMAWPAHAVATGQNPFFSPALLPPRGVNLLADTSTLAMGIPLTPVTWLFGPVATLNTALTLSPALSAVAMCWLVRRWVSWWPAAFVAGLVYGFSAFALGSLANAHLMTGLLVVPPLLVACLDELLVRQRHRPVVVGVVLGLLVVVQYFIGVELLLLMAMAAATGVVLLVVAGLVGAPAGVRQRLPGAAVGLGTGTGVAVVGLAYPLWYSLAGPGHLPAKVWPSLPSGTGGVALANLWRPPPPSSAAVVHFQHQLGAYQGPALPNGEYLGLGLLVVVVAGTMWWRRDRRLWFFGGLGLLCLALSLGKETHAWVPWRVLARLPVAQNVVPGRMMAMVDVCAAILLALVLDHLWQARARAAPWLGRAAASVAAVGAVVPLALAMGGNVPLTVVPVVLPQWFSQVAPTLPPGSVVLAFPVPFSLQESAETWQAVDGMHFTLAGSGDWEGRTDRAGRQEPGMTLLANLSMSDGDPVVPTVGDVAAVREVLRAWGVTTVVVPDQADLPAYERLARPSAVVALVTVATGQRPTYRAHAWVWDARRPAAPLVVSPPAYEACVGTEPRAPGPPATVPDCLWRAGHR